VLFGRSLPSKFFECVEEDLPVIDCLLVIGSSLVVFPAASVVYEVPRECVRVLVNLERVGQSVGFVPSGEDGKPAEREDVFLQGKCDEQIKALAEAMGCLPRLEQLMKDCEEPHLDGAATESVEVEEGGEGDAPA
jgi:NAD+-dependent protein deacetylase SIR2